MKFASHAITLVIGILLGYVIARGVAVTSTPTPVPTMPVAHKAVAPSIPEEMQKPAPRATIPVSEVKPATPKPIVGKPSLESLKASFDQELDKGNLKAAALVVQEMEKLGPTSQIYFESQGSILAHQQNWKQAKGYLKKCVEAYPQSKSCLLDLSSAELQVGTQEDQVAAAAQCLSAMPEHPICRSNSAIVYLTQSDFDSAISMYQQLIKDNGSEGFRFADGLLQWQLALSYEGAGQADEARASFQKACQSQWQAACNRLESLKEEEQP